jgi:septal ring-binding cell division protein DamX
MLKKYLFFMLAIIAISVFITGCSSSTNAERRYGNVEDEFEQAPPQVVIETPPTQPAVVNSESELDDESSNDAVYTVQLGAFKSVRNVETFEKLIKSKFTLPIKTEFDDQSKFYKVSVGEFNSKDEAYELRDFCVKNGYKDAWVTVFK